MNIGIYPKYIQIQICEDNMFLNKILENAKRYFSHTHKLSNTLLILDDKRKVKKEYFLNWVYHLQECKSEIRVVDLFKFSLLPIRIKILRQNSIAHCIRIPVEVLSPSRIRLKIPAKDLRVKRAILGLFQRFICDITEDEVLLNSNAKGFWEEFMILIQERIVGNLLLSFDFKRRQKHLTRQELHLESEYLLLDSQIGDDFEAVRKRYIRLVRQYHPDNVFGENADLVQCYQQKFLLIRNAFETIRASLAKA
ncbi:hypothetical protein BBW65_03865 [Helicobacter enhydrae]|uniref:J domain-containing protein n=1 Tax=Helicobacter enhydrae TaxID=222136 RepID=A0A1B1U5B4_9HELI|nr:J domain-containing protein [Helicobacter enhydrae]ANV97987.1 hypothetical protein BBW65_03865 [Helicobacter enhydrae]